MRLVLLVAGGDDYLLLPKEPAIVDADDPSEGGRRCHDPPDDELPPWPPAGTENQDFGIAAGLSEEEGLGKGEEDNAVLEIL